MDTTRLHMKESHETGKVITEEEPKDKGKRILELKLRASGNPDSIFILPYGTEGFKMAHMARTGDKLMSLVKRKFGISIDVQQSKEIFREFEDFAGNLWKFVYKLSPNLHNIEPKDWRRVNDTIEVKKTIAYRRASIAVEPRSEESAMIAMAVKIIQQKNVELRQTSTFDELEKFVREYVKLLSGFDSLLKNASEKLSVEYRTYLKDEK
jgi:hypothetical protein